MPLRRARQEPIDLDGFDRACAELTVIREAHETCTETPRDCRAGILWATNTTLLQLTEDAPLEPGLVRSLLLEHASQVNHMLDARNPSRMSGLRVVGDRLQVAAAIRR